MTSVSIAFTGINNLDNTREDVDFPGGRGRIIPFACGLQFMF